MTSATRFVVVRYGSISAGSSRQLLAGFCRSSLRRAPVKSNAHEWSVTMQVGGKGHVITHLLNALILYRR